MLKAAPCIAAVGDSTEHGAPAPAHRASPAGAAALQELHPSPAAILLKPIMYSKHC